MPLRAGPPTTRSTDSSSAALVITVPCSRAVSRAASLMTLARSAPDMPTVRLARDRKSTSGANGLPLECTARIACRPFRSGAPTGICRSNRPGTQQRRVEDVGPVGGGDQDDAALGLEAVHLHQQLVQRLFALVVTAAHAGAAVPADGVDLVDEDDRRAHSPWPARTGRGPGWRRRRRTSRRSPSRRWCRTAPRPHRRPHGRAASCRCRAGRTAARPWGSSRRAPGTGPGSAGSRGSRRVPRPPRRRRPRR